MYSNVVIVKVANKLSPPKFLGCIDNQILLSMVLRKFKAFATVFPTFYPDSSAMNGVKVCEKIKDFLWKETCYSVRIILIGHLLFHLPDSKPGHIFLSPLVLKFVSVFVAVFEAF